MKNEALPAVPNMEESQAEALTAAARQGRTAHWQTTCPATLDLFHLYGACPSSCTWRTYHGTMQQNAERAYPAVGNKTSTHTQTQGTVSVRCWKVTRMNVHILVYSLEVLVVYWQVTHVSSYLLFIRLWSFVCLPIPMSDSLHLHNKPELFHFIMPIHTSAAVLVTVTQKLIRNALFYRGSNIITQRVTHYTLGVICPTLSLEHSFNIFIKNRLKYSNFTAN